MKIKKYLNEEFILTPLYKKCEFDPKDNAIEFAPVEDYKLELYCPICKNRRIFKFRNETAQRYYNLTGHICLDSISDYLDGKRIFRIFCY